MADPHFVCDRCGHTWSAPFFPDRCENCRAVGSELTEFVDIDDAESYSAFVIGDDDA